MKRTELTGRGNKGSTKGRSRHLLVPVRPLFGMSERASSAPRSIVAHFFVQTEAVRKAIWPNEAEVIGYSDALLDEGVSRKSGPQVYGYNNIYLAICFKIKPQT